MSVISSSEAVKSLGQDAVEAMATGVVFAGIDVAIDKQGFNKLLALRAAQSAGSALGANVIGKTAIPSVVNMGSFSRDAVTQFLPPLLSGGVYVGVNMLTKYDIRPPLMQFLYQAGSHAAGAYISAPISKAILKA